MNKKQEDKSRKKQWENVCVCVFQNTALKAEYMFVYEKWDPSILETDESTIRNEVADNIEAKILSELG